MSAMIATTTTSSISVKPDTEPGLEVRIVSREVLVILLAALHAIGAQAPDHGLAALVQVDEVVTPGVLGQLAVLDERLRPVLARPTLRGVDERVQTLVRRRVEAANAHEVVEREAELPHLDPS